MAVGSKNETALLSQTVNLVARHLKDNFVDRLVDHTDDLCVVGTNDEISIFVENNDNIVDEVTNNVVNIDYNVGPGDYDKPIANDILLIDGVDDIDRDVDSQVVRTSDVTLLTL